MSPSCSSRVLPVPNATNCDLFPLPVSATRPQSLNTANVNGEKSFKCRTCGKEFEQSTNYARHMGLVHKLTTKEEEIDSATLARYASCAKSGRSEPNKPNQLSEPLLSLTLEGEPAAYAEPDEPESPPLSPKTSGGQKAQLKNRRIRAKVDIANTSSGAELGGLVRSRILSGVYPDSSARLTHQPNYEEPCIRWWRRTGPC